MAPLLALLLCTLPCILLASASVSPFPPLPSSRPFPSHGDGEGLHILRAPGSAAPSSSSASRRLRTGLSRVAEPNTNDWGLPFVPAGKLLLDLDPHTTVIDGAVTAASPSYTRSIVFNPATESVCFFLNNSVKVLSITLEFPGGLPALSQPVDMGYLESVPEWGTKAYQSAIIKPSMFARTSLCNFAGNNSLLPSCQVDLTIQSAPPGASVPFHLSIMQMPVLPLGTSSGLVGGEAGQLISYAMDAHQSDLPIVVWLLSEQTDPEQLSNHMLYWFNARNPLQYLSPERSQFAEHKERGELIGMGFGPSYGSRAAPTSTQPISRKLPSSGGNARADPLYFRGPAASPILAGDSELWDELYIACAWPLGDSRASFGTDTHRFTMDFVRNYAVESMEVNLGLSMFGVVGALTVLVLCLFSAAAIVIKRRSQANQLHVEEMAAIGLVLRRNREGADAADAADRPAFDAEGRPLRYDAHGRLIPDLGAKKEVVAALPTRVFVSGMLPDEDAHCTICLGEYEAGESIKELPCAHVFHDACISKWLLQKGHCVLCQQKLSEAVPQGQAQPRIINVAPAAADVAAGEAVPLNARNGGSPAAGAAGAAGESPTASPYRGTEQSPERSSWMRADAAGSNSSNGNGGGTGVLGISHPLTLSPRDRDRDRDRDPSRTGPRSVARPHAIILHYDDADPTATPQRAPLRSQSWVTEETGGRQPTPPGSVNEAAAEGKEAEEERSERSVQSISRSTQRTQPGGGVTIVAVRPQS